MQVSPPPHVRFIKAVSGVTDGPIESIRRSQILARLLCCSYFQLQSCCSLVDLLELCKMAVEYSDHLRQLFGNEH